MDKTSYMWLLQQPARFSGVILPTTIVTLENYPSTASYWSV